MLATWVHSDHSQNRLWRAESGKSSWRRRHLELFFRDEQGKVESRAGGLSGWWEQHHLWHGHGKWECRAGS